MSKPVMLRTIFSPCVAVIRHSQWIPSGGGSLSVSIGGENTAELVWNVLPHSATFIIRFCNIFNQIIESNCKKQVEPPYTYWDICKVDLFVQCRPD